MRALQQEPQAFVVGMIMALISPRRRLLARFTVFRQVVGQARVQYCYSYRLLRLTALKREFAGEVMRRSVFCKHFNEVCILDSFGV